MKAPTGESICIKRRLALHNVMRVVWLLVSMACLGTAFTSPSAMKFIQSSSLSHLDARVAKLVDDKLFSIGFSLDQLMELAGLSVACAVHDFLQQRQTGGAGKNTNVLVLSGPGNNGGDGLVAARHLKQFGYSPTVVYPKQSPGSLFQNLVQQLRESEVPISTTVPTALELDSSAVVVDAVFGFSFVGPAREPFSSIIDLFRSSKTPVLSVDIPSGWHVEQGDVYNTHFQPSAVISLTLPKLCMQSFKGIHYVGGRFVPPSLQKELALTLPDYGFGDLQIARVVDDSPVSSVTKTQSEFVVMYTTAPSEEEAHRIAAELVERRLAACINIVPQIQSVYRWDNKIETSKEIMLMIKTTSALAAAATEWIKSTHSYDVPESIVLPIDAAGSNSDYLKWVRDETVSP